MYILVCVALIEIFNVLEIKDVCAEILLFRFISVIILCGSALKYFIYKKTFLVIAIFICSLINFR